VYSSEIRKFDDDEVQFLEAVANLSAIALENARMHQVLRRDFDLLVAHEYRVDDI
jgi:GAF domain-containing protein